MNIIAVDDERYQLEALEQAVNKVEPDAKLVTFRKSREALEYAKDNNIDVALLDIEMPILTGVELAKELKKINPRVNIIFCTGYDEYALEAMQIKASGYLLKPIKASELENELNNLRHEVKVESQAKIYAQCFGNFQLYINGSAIEFKFDMSKEIVAYLVDKKGSMCSNNEIISELWEDDGNHKSYFQDLRKDIKDTLREAGAPNLVEFGWGKMRIDTEQFQCDYYDWIEGKASGINAYTGDYMSSYTWAEKTNASLFNK